mgnify:CR=1 FL=1|jgi:hypothetical protein|tara:strand:- start:225 stop:839 length:615 start_codon:yes stop_codon:yes gene_type:complete
MGLISNGTTIFDAGAMTAGIGSSMTLIKKITASSSSTISFVNGASSVVLDATYKEYILICNNLHPANNDVALNMNLSIDGGSNYNVAKTSSAFRASHNENDDGGSLDYRTGEDLANGTGTQYLATGVGGDNDQSCCGILTLFNPGNTAHEKEFSWKGQNQHEDQNHFDYYVNGYANTSSAINAVQFSFASGAIASGTITLYGIA